MTAHPTSSDASAAALLPPELAVPAPPKPARSRPRFASEEKRRQALKLFDAGFGYKRVAGELGLPVNTVRDWARAYRAGRFHIRINANQYRYDKFTKRQVILMRLRGRSWSDISEATGVPCSTCRTWMRTLGAALGRERL